MKYTLLILTFIIGLADGFAQTETTVWNGKTYFVYPHQFVLIDITETFLPHAEAIEILKRDDNNQKVIDVSVWKFSEEELSYRRGNRKMTRKEKEEEKLIVELMSKKPDYYYYNSEATEGDITPALTPIPDGDYVQFYRDLPYLDNGVLRFRNNVVAGVFHIKNNQLDGDASWYTANGMLLRKGTFSGGARHGSWVFNSYNLTMNITGYNIYDELESTRYLIDHSIEYDTVTENISYQKGLRNGPYSLQQNSQLQTTGFYKNDVESGSWDFYSQKVELNESYVEGMTYEDLYIRTNFIQKHYVIADHPVRGKGIILRDEIVASEYVDPNPYDDYWQEYLFDTSLDLLLPAWFDNFETFYSILTEDNTEESIELPEEEVNSYDGEEEASEPAYPEYSNDNFNWSDEPDTNDYSQSGWQFIGNKYYTRNQLIDSIGYLFVYEAYEERYGNGQLKFRFKTENGNLVSEDTVFWDSGIPANTIVFDETKHLYEQHFFDYWGKLYKTTFFDEKGETIHFPKKNRREMVDEIPEDAPIIIDGLPYLVEYERSPMYYSDRQKLGETPLTERTLIEAARWPHDSTLCSVAYLDPATNTLDYARTNVLGDTIIKQRVQFDELYETATATIQHTLGKLRLETISSGTLNTYSNPWSDYVPETLPQLNALYWEGNYDLQNDYMLYCDDRPFSGSFSLSLGNKKQHFSASEDKLNIRLMDNRRQSVQMDKALDKYLKNHKRNSLLEAYTPETFYGESAFANFFPHCLRFVSFGTDLFDYGFEELFYYGDDNQASEMVYNGSIAGTYFNGKPHGEWIVKNESGEITTRMNYEKGELEGELFYYATKLPREKEEEQNYFYKSNYPTEEGTYPAKKVRYIAQKETYHNGLLEGPFVTMDWQGVVLTYEQYHEGLKNGISYQRNRYFYNESRFENGMLDGISLTYLTLPERDSILLYELNFQDGALQGESKTYHTNGKLAKRGFFLGGQPIDDYEAFDTLGFRYQYVKFQYNQPVEEKIWEENQLSARYLFDWKDSIPFDISDIAESSSFENLINSEGIWNSSYNEPYYGRPSLVDKTGINYSITKYYPNDSVARFGSISKGKKVGYWKHFSYEGKALYEINYFDTLLVINDSVRFKSKGILTYLGENNRPLSRSYIIEKVEKYDCSHTDHTEERMLYTFWEADSMQQRINGYVKNYYDNGAIQNEGYVVNGLATGIWKMYDSDGQLSQVGNYKLGKRDGRWLKGDLSNVKNMSEICLNPNLENLEEIIAYQEKLLDISVVYYGMGKILKSEYYGINMNPDGDPSGYRYYDEDNNENGRW
ncbi:MAG: hypothetical protein QE487_18875 [Fluviicola sp.]|nr:hypothetical protein [Fluviicola sp.]